MSSDRMLGGVGSQLKAGHLRRRWGLPCASTWRTHAAPCGAAWNVGGYMPAHRTHPFGVCPKSHHTPSICIAACDPESSILTLYDSQPQTGIVQPFTTPTLPQSGKRIVWSIPDGD
mgnify:CR=1 FL=1